MFAALALGSVVVLGAVSAAPATTAAPAAGPLHEIVHVKALTPYCTAFEKHFNGAAQPMVAADAQVGYLGFTLGTIENHFNSLDSENKLYDDRVHMMAYVGSLQRLVPQAQGEINALRVSAKLAPDADTAKADVALASDLQTALDKQRQVATDLLGVVQALTDYTVSPTRLSLDDLGTQLAYVAGLAELGRLTNGSAPRSSFVAEAAALAADSGPVGRAAPQRSDLRSYLHWQNQLDRLDDAENSAARRADAIADSCR